VQVLQAVRTQQPTMQHMLLRQAKAHQWHMLTVCRLHTCVCALLAHLAGFVVVTLIVAALVTPE
jgi:hypothetical protein